MKFVKLILLLVSSTLIFSACKDDNITYAEELKAEQNLIKTSFHVIRLKL